MCDAQFKMPHDKRSASKKTRHMQTMSAEEVLHKNMAFGCIWQFLRIHSLANCFLWFILESLPSTSLVEGFSKAAFDDHPGIASFLLMIIIAAAAEVFLRVRPVGAPAVPHKKGSFTLIGVLIGCKKDAVLLNLGGNSNRHQ